MDESRSYENDKLFNVFHVCRNSKLTFKDFRIENIETTTSFPKLDIVLEEETDFVNRNSYLSKVDELQLGCASNTGVPGQTN